MAAKKTKKVAKPAKATRAQAHKQIEIDGAEVEVRAGSHPVFHDLERKEALRKTASRKDPDIDLLRGLLADADERLGQIQEIVGRTRDALIADEERLKTNADEDIPDAVEDLQGKIVQAQEHNQELSDELGLAKTALKEVESKSKMHENAYLCVVVERDTARAERDAALAAKVAAAETLKETLSSLHAAEHAVSELAEVEVLATALATMIGAEAQRQTSNGNGPAIIDMTNADEQTIELFQRSLELLRFGDEADAATAEVV